MEINRVGNFALSWGESLLWDEERQRLYFVDCFANALHWLEDGDGELHTITTPSMPTGIVATTDGRVVAVLEDGLYVIDPDARTSMLLSRFPDEIGGRCNDLCADFDGNLITGKLNLGPAEGSAWWYSPARGWRVIDRDISNTNGPAVGIIDGAMTLIIGDTSAHYYSYPYDAASGAVGERTIFGDCSLVTGAPDGTTLDPAGGLWAALFGGSQLARFTSAGLDQTLDVPVQNPTDVTFGGRDLDRLYVVSTGAPPDADPGLNGALLVIDGLDTAGRAEPRASIA